MTSRALVIAATAAACAFCTTEPGHAERLVTSLSNHRVLITSNFTGADLVLFGSIERDAATVARRGGYDIVVTATGPRQAIVTRRKQHVFGIWINTSSRTFIDPPNFLAVRANKPLAEIASPDVRRQLRVGLDEVVLHQLAGGRVIELASDDTFRLAFLRLQTEHGLYNEQDNAITFLTPTLFRANIQLPANVPVGTYEVDVKLFADGVVIARENSAFEIAKVGFEQFVANAAHQHGALYGLATASLALVIGWFASIIFRRD
jgi:uncharacterized protein (TIGR02186 family)